jgi:hypothetical protein
MTSLRRLEELRTDARYHRGCLERYRANADGSAAAHPVELRELELACVFSEARVSRAEREIETESLRRG